MTSSLSPTRPVLFFDVDGTLYDTHDLVTKAYRFVGVDMPPGAWGRSWREWLPDLAGVAAEELHARKNAIYVDLLETHRVPALSAFWVAHMYYGRGDYDVRLVTSASDRAARALLSRDAIGHALVATEVTVASLIEMFNDVRLTGARCAFIDDDERRVELLRAALVDVSVYHYARGDSYDTVATWVAKELPLHVSEVTHA